MIRLESSVRHLNLEFKTRSKITKRATAGRIIKNFLHTLYGPTEIEKEQTLFHLVFGQNQRKSLKNLKDKKLFFPYEKLRIKKLVRISPHFLMQN